MKHKYTIIAISDLHIDWSYKEYKKNSYVLKVCGGYDFLFNAYTKAKTFGKVELFLNDELKSRKEIAT